MTTPTITPSPTNTPCPKNTPCPANTPYPTNKWLNIITGSILTFVSLLSLLELCFRGNVRNTMIVNFLDYQLKFHQYIINLLFSLSDPILTIFLMVIICIFMICGVLLLKPSLQKKFGEESD